VTLVRHEQAVTEIGGYLLKGGIAVMEVVLRPWGLGFRVYV